MLLTDSHFRLPPAQQRFLPVIHRGRPYSEGVLQQSKYTNQGWRGHEEGLPWISSSFCRKWIPCTGRVTTSTLAHWQLHWGSVYVWNTWTVGREDRSIITTSQKVHPLLFTFSIGQDTMTYCTLSQIDKLCTSMYHRAFMTHYYTWVIVCNYNCKLSYTSVWFWSKRVNEALPY